LEAGIDTLEKGLPPLKAFILPGGSPAAAALHLARCVCRRAEREIVALSEQTQVRPLVLKYVNRVSDLLFVLARTANAEAGVGDTEWEKVR
jgi:cob(I)alamin adenosyltransferase